MRVQADRFVDEQGRTLMLRGVNLGGSSKVPCVPDGATWRSEGFFDHRDVSFVGRPFPLEEADEHLGRIARWGFTFVRLLTTWEAIEHAGPGVYDDAYLEYLRAVVERAADHGILVLIDPHQDVWSRFSGGDGAPGWTFEAAGMDVEALYETGAAVTHQQHGDPLPKMLWPSNYGRLANLTMWTLFFAGNLFAPRTCIDGVPIQEYLQRHYVEAVAHLASRLAGLPNVLGFDTLNEPGTGLIGVSSLDRWPFPLRLGPCPTPLQAMALGAGIPQEVHLFELGLAGFRSRGTMTVNPRGRSVWVSGRDCIWREHGVWDVDATGTPHALRPSYFASAEGRDIDFWRDCLAPFARRFTTAIRRHLPDATVFLEGPPATRPTATLEGLRNVVYAPHWYDALTLLRKSYTPWLGADARTGRLVVGKRRVERSFAAEIAALVHDAREGLGVPAIIGECGIPFDMDGKRAYRTGDFSAQIRALDATMRALERNGASFALWNYTADNTHERGDQWNDEDFSVYSRDQRRGTGSLDDGGRALEAAVRPYPLAVPGDLREVRFDLESRTFSCTFCLDRCVHAPAQFFVPEVQYPKGFAVTAPHGTTEVRGQTMTYAPETAVSVHTVVVRPTR